MGRLGRAVLVLASCLLVGCGSTPTLDGERTQPLAFEVAGCARVTVQGECELGDGPRHLTLFVRAPQFGVHAAGRPLATSRAQAVQGGQTVELDVPPGVDLLTLHGAGRLASLRIVPDRYPPALTALRALRASGRLTELEAGLHEQTPRLRTPCERARLDGLRARAAFSAGRSEEAETHYRASIPALVRCGFESEAAADGFALFYVLSEQRHDPDAAEQVLDDVARALAHDADARGWLEHYRAGAALRRGDLALAFASIDRALDAAERLRMTALASVVLMTRAWLEALLGRHDQAARTVDTALSSASAQAPCERAALLTTAGYQRLLAAEAGQGTLEDARAPLLTALALSEAHCKDRPLAPRILVNLAQASLLEGDLARAEGELGRAGTPAADDRMLHVTLLDVRGRVLAAAGRHRAALAVYDELVQRLSAASVALPQGQLGRGRALAALGRTGDAVLALQDAEAQLDRQIAEVPLSAGRDVFAFGRREVSRQLIEVLLAQDDVAGAVDAAQRHQARLLGSLRAASARSDPEWADALAAYTAARAQLEAAAAGAWQLPDDALEPLARAQAQRRADAQRALDRLFAGATPTPRGRSPAPGEVLLAIVPLEHDVALLVRSGVRAEALRVAPAEVAASLGSLAPSFAGSARLTVLAPSQGTLASPHTVLVAGAPLIAHVPVAYAAGLAPAPHAASARERALFVFDPRGDLPGAAREARLLRGQLGAGPSVDFREGRAATRSQIMDDLLHARTLHFAGHAHRSPHAFWESGLALALDSQLSTADVLSLARVPESVVLAACDTATASNDVGIAQAFLVRGAQEVVATTEPVDDQVAAEFTRAFYAAPSADGARRVQYAVSALRERGLPWTAYRLLVP